MYYGDCDIVNKRLYVVIAFLNYPESSNASALLIIIFGSQGVIFRALPKQYAA